MTGDGPGRWARFATPAAVAVSNAGVVYVTDEGNHRIVRGVIDSVTTPPALSEPGANSVIRGLIPICFTLPEVASPGTLKLIFTGASSRTLRLAGFLETDGPHRFSLDPKLPSLSPMIAEIAGGADIPPGVYAVALEYLDEAGNPAATAVSENLTIAAPDIAVHDGAPSGPELTDGQTTALNFGRNTQGTQGTRNITIANTGTAELLVSNVTVPPGYTALNVPPLPLTVGLAQSVTFQISLATLTVGTHAGSVVIASDDLDETAFDFPITGEVFIPDPVSNVVSTTTTLNRQTGLREQTIHLTNDTTATVPAYNLIIRGLPAGVEVNNASETRADGSVVVYIRQGMSPHSAQDIVIEYYSPNRAPAEISPQLSTEVILQPPDLTVTTGTADLDIENLTRRTGGEMLLEFTSTPGRRYEVEYSSDGESWQSSFPLIRAASNRTQWIDRGLPRTHRHPSLDGTRLYRVREIAP